MLTLDEVMDRSHHERRPTHEVANEMAKARISLAAEEKAAA
jgi:leucine dehydrogenase